MVAPCLVRLSLHHLLQDYQQPEAVLHQLEQQQQLEVEPQLKDPPY